MMSGPVYDTCDNFRYLSNKYRNLPELFLLPCTAVFVTVTASTRATTQSSRLHPAVHKLSAGKFHCHEQ
jgi:hypothetical protein